MTALAATLNDAGCIVEPVPPPPAMTLEDGAKLLCRLSRTRLLDDPENDYVQLIDRSDRVDYAWANAVQAGIPVDAATEANEARRLLLAHHGLR